MKIVFLADSISNQKSGIHYYGLQLIERLLYAHPQHDYHIIASENIDQFDIPQTIIPCRNSLHMRWRQFTSIPRAVKELNPDHVIELAHFGPFNLPDNIKKTTVIHDLTPINYPKYHGFLSHWTHRLLLPRVIKNADRIIVNSVCTSNDVEKYNASTKGKISIIYPHVNLPKTSTTNKVSLPGKYILSVGTVEPRKNYDLLLNAFKVLGREDKDLSLVIAGKVGWKNESFHKLLEDHPFKERIFQLGYVHRNDLWNLYEHASLFVFPSHYEGFGIPVLESMYHAVPMLLSHIPTSIEIASDAAIYFDKESVEDLTNKMKYLLLSKDVIGGLQEKSRNRFKEITQLANKQLNEFENFLTEGIE